jgi:hypothetical protein
MMFRNPKAWDRRSSPATAACRTASPPPPREIGLRGGTRREETGETRTAPTEAALAHLDQALAALNPSLEEAVITAAVVINPLLDIWDAARSIDPYVSAPVEQLLTVLVERTTVTPAELTATLNGLRIAALQASVLVALAVA